MSTYLNQIYNSINLLNKVTTQEVCSTTIKVIKASQPIFPLLLPQGILTSIQIAEKSYTLASKIDNLYTKYFFSNKKFTHSKGIYSPTKKFQPYSKKGRHLKKIFPAKQILEISLAGISLHTTVYKTFFGKVIGSLEKTIDSLLKMYTLSSHENSIIVEKGLTLIKNIIVLFVIIGGYEQIMISVHILQFAIALTKIYIETNNEEYLIVYTQLLWIIVSLLQIHMIYQKSFDKKEVMNKRAI